MDISRALRVNFWRTWTEQFYFNVMEELPTHWASDSLKLPSSHALTPHLLFLTPITRYNATFAIILPHIRVVPGQQSYRSNYDHAARHLHFREARLLHLHFNCASTCVCTVKHFCADRNFMAQTRPWTYHGHGWIAYENVRMWKRGVKMLETLYTYIIITSTRLWPRCNNRNVFSLF